MGKIEFYDIVMPIDSYYRMLISLYYETVQGIL